MAAFFIASVMSTWTNGPQTWDMSLRVFEVIFTQKFQASRKALSMRWWHIFYIYIVCALSIYALSIVKHIHKCRSIYFGV